MRGQPELVEGRAQRLARHAFTDCMTLPFSGPVNVSQSVFEKSCFILFHRFISNSLFSMY
jgi:hypothetical protein